MADRLPVAVLHAQLVRQWLETTTDQMQAVEPRERYWESTLRYAMTGAGTEKGRAVALRCHRAQPIIVCFLSLF